jgi:uncharacterized protein YbaA (DUF1428 family)
MSMHTAASRPRQRQGVMNFPRRTDTDPKLLPFGCNRMVYEGFKVLVAA